MKLLIVACLSSVFLDVITARYINTQALKRNRRTTIRVTGRYRTSDPSVIRDQYREQFGNRDLHFYRPDTTAPRFQHRTEQTPGGTYHSEPVYTPQNQHTSGGYQGGGLSSQSSYLATSPHSPDVLTAHDSSYGPTHPDLSSLSSIQKLYKARVSSSQTVPQPTSSQDPSYPGTAQNPTADLSSLSSIQNLYRSRLTESTRSSPSVVQSGKISSVLSKRKMYQKALSAGQAIYRSRTKSGSSQSGATDRKTLVDPSSYDNHHLTVSRKADSRPVLDPAYDNSQPVGGETYPQGQAPVDPTHLKTTPEKKPVVQDPTYSSEQSSPVPAGSPYQSGLGAHNGQTVSGSNNPGSYTGPTSSNNPDLGPLDPHFVKPQPSNPDLAPLDPHGDHLHPTHPISGPLDHPPHTHPGPGLLDPHADQLNPTHPASGPLNHPPHSHPAPGLLDPHADQLNPTHPASGPLNHPPHTHPAPGLLDPHADQLNPTHPASGPLDHAPHTDPTLRPSDPHFNHPQPTNPVSGPLDPNKEKPSVTNPHPGPQNPHFDTPVLTNPDPVITDPRLNNPVLGGPLPTPQAFVDVGGPTNEALVAADPAPSPPRPVDSLSPFQPPPVDVLPDVQAPILAPLRNPIVESVAPPELPMFSNQPDSWVWGDRVTGKLLNFSPRGAPL